MLNFIFENQTKIIFGKNTETNVGREVKTYGSKVLLHYGKGSIKKSGLYDKVIQSLVDEKIEVVELSDVMPNPRLSKVNEGIQICRELGIDFILAVGGGSVIDSAKAIGFGAKYEGDVWDFFERSKEITDTIPIGVILTIPAAGSEASSGTVITKEEGWLKRSTGAQIVRPKFAIMNPELTYTLPNYQTACGVADMLAHVFERYFTNEPHVDFTDEMCEATMRTIIKHVKVVMNDPHNYDSRAEIMWAGTIAHNGLLGTGRREDWASHQIEHELSAIYDIPHGAGLAIIFPNWMKYVYKQDINRFARFANKVFMVEIDENNPEKTALEGISRLKSFFQEIELPTTLKDAHISDERLSEMAKKATEGKTLGSFVKLSEQDVLNIYHLSLN